MDEKKHLLIVDDELLIRDLLYDHFTDRDYAISLADCGESALGLLDSREFDTVILDLKMPDMDGLELAAIIQKKQQTVPIIIITGFPSIDSAVEALRRRYFDYFVKPFNMKKLEKAVVAAIQESETHDRHTAEVQRV